MDSSTNDATFPCNTDAWAWLESLPPLDQWKKPSLTAATLSSTLHLSATAIAATTLQLSVTAGNINLWSSKPLKLTESGSGVDSPLLSLQSLQTLFLNILHDFLHYDPNPASSSCISSSISYHDDAYYSFLFDNLQDDDHEGSNCSSSLNETFNLAFLSLSFLTSIYKQGPLDLIRSLKQRLCSPASQDASWQLMRALGSTLEERWMRSLNLTITNLEAHLDSIVHEDDNKDVDASVIDALRTRCPSTLFSRAVSGLGMVKVKLYFPLSAMEVESSSGSADDPLMFSLNHHHLEGVVQLNYNVAVRDKWVDLLVSVDNIRLNVVALIKEGELYEKLGAEKHFPSRIALQLTPSPPSTDILSVSVSKSSDNPTQEIGRDRTIEGSLDPTSMPGLRVSASASTTTTLKPWKFEESALGDTGSLSWFLHDSDNGREVFATKPSLVKQLLHPKGANRYSAANRPFTRQGGVVFAKDEYGDKAICWKVDKAGLGRRMRWEVRGSVGLTYWPNQHRTLYNDTRRADFVDTFHLTIL